MGVIQATIRTVKCDKCEITTTFEVTERGVAQEIVDANPWLSTGRLINTTDGRVYFYCSDKCEVEGTASGLHNKPEPKKIIDSPANNQAVAVAAAIAAQRDASTKALKEGTGGKVQL